MRLKKIQSAVLVASIVVSMSACTNDNSAKATTTTAASTTTAATTVTTTAAETTTTATETETETKETEEAVNGSISDAESVKVYYGWGQDEDEYTAEVFCPEGAKFDEYTLESYAEEGLIMMAEVVDETNEYSAVSNSYWHPDAYSSDDPILSILQQLYFNGEIDAATAEEYSNCSQKITPLGFKWNGYDVVMIETFYTFLDYGGQRDVFIGVEYDLKYWKANAGVGGIQNLTTKGLFGFDTFYYGLDEITQEHYAWIAGELFGVDTGIENPFAKNTDEPESVPVDIDPSALIGTWCDKESSWEDTYFFDYGGNGSYTSGFENTFTWSVEGNTLTVFYAEDDIDTFTITLDTDAIILVDEYKYEQRFVRMAEEEPEVTDEAESESPEEAENPNATAIIGTWTEHDTGYDETFTFYTDGTGHYSCLSEDGVYECGFTYNFFSNDFIDIYFDDGDIGGFLLAIDGDTMTFKNDFITDLTYTRQ